MQIQVNSDSSVSAGVELSRLVKSTVSGALKRFEGRITRVEVHLSDVSGAKFSSQDKRCVMEARPASQDPIAVVDQADSFEESVRGAALKLKKLLASRFDRTRRRR